MRDDFPASYAETFRLRYDECGPDGAARAAVHLRLFQEIAFGHSAAMGFPLAWYEAHRLFWVLRRAHLVVHTRAVYGDAVTYTTRVSGARRVMARRINIAVRTGDSAQVATCVTDWIFTHDGATPARIDGALAEAFPAMARTVTPLPLDDPPPPKRPRTPVHVRVADLDGVNHVNHTVYADLLDDAIVRAGGGEVIRAHPRTYDLQYQAGIRPGDEVREAAWRADGAWRYRMERGDGHLIMHGRLLEGEAPFDL